MRELIDDHRPPHTTRCVLSAQKLGLIAAAEDQSAIRKAHAKRRRMRIATLLSGTVISLMIGGGYIPQAQAKGGQGGTTSADTQNCGVGGAGGFDYGPDLAASYYDGKDATNKGQHTNYCGYNGGGGGGPGGGIGGKGIASDPEALQPIAGDGGDGGANGQVVNSNVNVSSDILAGDGMAGGKGIRTGASGGGGGAGGYGLIATDPANTITNAASIRAGRGGAGGAGAGGKSTYNHGGSGGGGGDGGVGIYSAAANVTNSGTVAGGAGGNGGLGGYENQTNISAYGGDGGAGGDAVTAQAGTRSLKLTNQAGATLRAGNGGSGGDNTDTIATPNLTLPSNGGAGGYGVRNFRNLTNRGTIIAGDGGDGANTIAGSSGEGTNLGGAGGDGFAGSYDGSGTVDNSGIITAGRGGDGGQFGQYSATRAAGNGGAGGYGVRHFSGRLENTGSITAGSGGNGGSDSQGDYNVGNGGKGGTGVEFSGTLTNRGTITGGAGGAGGTNIDLDSSFSTDAANGGDGGAAIDGDGVVINAGKVIAGIGGAAGSNNATEARAGADGLAIRLSSGSTLEIEAGSEIIGQVAVSRNDNGASSGHLVLDAETAFSFSGGISSDLNQPGFQYQGFVDLTKDGNETAYLSGTNSYSGPTYLVKGTLSVSSDDSLGILTGPDISPLTFQGGTLQITGTTMTSTPRSIIWQSGGGGFDIADASNVFTISQEIGTAAEPGGKLAKAGAGTLVLTGTNYYGGGTELQGGTLSVSSDHNLGDASGNLSFSGGTLQVTETMNSARAVNLATDGGTVLVDSGKTLTLSGRSSDLGAAHGALSKTGDGTLVLAATNSYSGGTTIAAGILQLGDGTPGHDGQIVGDIINNGALVVANLGDSALDGDISGTGTLTQSGAGVLRLSGKNDYSGDTQLFAGTVSVAQEANLGITASALTFDGGTLQVTGTDFNQTSRTINWGNNGGGFDIVDANNSFTVSSALSGTGAFTKTGAGALVLSADSSGYSGAVDVRAGDLRLDGAILGGSLSVDNQADLGGHGTIRGAASFASGATLFGQSNQQITFDNGLTLASGSQTDVTLNGAPSTQALFDVHGDLALNGTLNVEQGSVVGAGVYRIFDYSGTLTDNGMTIGTVADGDVTDYSLQTAIDHQVNLISTGGRNFFFWDGTGTSGDGTIHGGDGTWDAATSNWTGADGQNNTPWFDDTFAVFAGSAGTVTIDAGFAPSVNGMQFMNDGYLLTGGALTLAGYGDQLIIVGDGSLQSSSMTATIASVIEGSEGLRKSGAGQLVLTADNTYTGTTTVTEGLLTLGEGGRINASSDIVLASTRYGTGNLAIDKTTDFTLSNQISGTGDVFKRGIGTTTFAADNSFSGGLNVEAGTAKAGVADHAFGSGRVKIAGGATLDLADLNETIGGLDGNQSGDGNITLGSGTLTLNQDLHGGYSGVISGSGGIIKNGSGDLVLYGANDYSGQSTINAGSLVQGAQGGFSSASTYSVASGATVELGGFATSMAGLNNAGSVAFGGQGGTVLTINGDYVGNGGTLLMSTILGDDSAQTDQLVVTGNTAGDTKLSISNRGGLGAQTVNGIKIIDVGGQSDGRFTLNGDYTTKDGQQAIMTASAYAYTLQKGSGQNGGQAQGSVQASGSANTDGNWYLVSQNTKAPDPSDPVDPTCEETNSCPPPQPGGPRYSAAAPVYESYLANLKALNQLPTLTQRVGDRYLDGDIQATTATSAGETTPSGIWGRIEGAHNRLQSASTAGDLNQNINTVILQAGL
uniref:autotransporter-associated beta strand repeat-containing protein n=4 Tax=Ochrobactrum quorumnocens TaxID=271865 RepID=UPI003B9EE8FD